MASKDIRVITASEDVAAVIDRGAEVDAQIKTLTKEDKGLKGKITEAASVEIQDGEVSVKLEGSKAKAVVTASESMSVNASAESYPKFREALDKGFLVTVVEEKKSLVLPPDDIERACQILKEAGIEATVSYSVSVKAEDIRKMRNSEVSSIEESEARSALEGCLSSKVTHRVKYESAGEGVV